MGTPAPLDDAAFDEAVIRRLASTGGSKLRVKIACPCIDKDDVPVTDFGKLSRNFIAYVQDEPLLTFGMTTAKAYELIVEKCIQKGMTHVIMVESDVIAPRGALPRLMIRSVIEGHAFVCGSYPFKDHSDMSVAVWHGPDGRSVREPYPYKRRGLVQVDRALPMGCCVIDLRAVAGLPRPWFRDGSVPNTDTGESESITQDTYFTNKMILAGHKPMLDTDIQCVHVCRETRRCFGSPDYVIGGRLRLDAMGELAVRDAGWWLGYQGTSAPVVFDGLTASAPGYFVVHGKRKDGGERVSIEVSAADLIEAARAASAFKPSFAPEPPIPPATVPSSP
jgi:hypothetical protein